MAANPRMFVFDSRTIIAYFEDESVGQNRGSAIYLATVSTYTITPYTNTA